jgi:hypothetical protein
MKRIAHSSALITAICLAEAAFAPPPAQAQVETRVPAVTTSVAPTTFPTGPVLLAQTAGEPALTRPAAVPPAPETEAVLPVAGQQAVNALASEGGVTAYSGAPGAWSAGMGGMAYGSTGRGEHALVVRSSETDPKTIAEVEEDLNVMGLILEKALYQSGDEEEREAMGIRLWSTSGSPVRRSLEIEGYGAIFLLNVNFPLAGPAEKPDEDKKEPSNSTWDKAKRELYGQSEGYPDVNLNRFSKEEYDPKRVEKLKDSLLEALKNAANIRGLKSDESVTVVVTSHLGPRVAPTRVFRGMQKNGTATGGFGGIGRFGGGGSGGGGMAMNPLFVDGNINGEGQGESVLTIRARKSDIDVFAKGKLTMDDFRKKASVLIY